MEEEVNCKPYNIYDLETGECLHEDSPIPIPQITTVKNVRITGKGETLFRVLLQNGITKNHIEELKKNYTYNIRDYVHNYKQQNLEASPIFSKTVRLKNITMDLSSLPPDSEYIPDFFTLEQSKILFNTISKNYFHGNNFVELNRPITEHLLVKPYFPGWLICFIHLLIKANYITKYPDNVYINYLGKGQGMNKHQDDHIYDDKVLILSLCSHCLMKFTDISNGKWSIAPILSGSLLILKGKSRYNYSREISNSVTDVYKIPGFPDQIWNRDSRISVILRFSK